MGQPISEISCSIKSGSECRHALGLLDESRVILEICLVCYDVSVR